MIHNDLIIAQRLAYEPCGLMIKNVMQEVESQEYGACAFEMNTLRIKFRAAKITPTKIGQFVTFWKRSKAGPIAPYDSEDPFDFLVVSVRSNNRLGQFVFPKQVLYQKSVLAHDNKGGKRALRVYPPWDAPESLIAKKTQAWQRVYFFEIEPMLDCKMVRKLFLN